MWICMQTCGCVLGCDAAAAAAVGRKSGVRPRCGFLAPSLEGGVGNAQRRLSGRGAPATVCRHARYRHVAAAQRTVRCGQTGNSPRGELEMGGAGGGDGAAKSLPRRTMAALALIGAVETSFLSFKKLTGGVASLCSTAGCAEVLAGPYSLIAGVPLTLFGMAGYALVAALSIYPLLTNDPKKRAEQDQRTRLPLAALSVAMGTFSAYLMFVLFVVVGGWCPWCISSAALSESLLVLVLANGGIGAARGGSRAGADDVSGAKSERRRLSWRGASLTAAATLAASLVVFVTTPGGVLDASTIRDPPPVRTASSAATRDMTTRLKSKNARMFGAYWCSHCHAQKELLGREAFADIEYVECASNGRNSQARLCQDKKIAGYPAWEIDGRLFFGEQTMDDLDEILTTGKKANDPYADLIEEMKELGVEK